MIAYFGESMTSGEFTGPFVVPKISAQALWIKEERIWWAAGDSNSGPAD